MNKSKTFMLVSIITLVVVLIGSASTYAWYVWTTSESEQVKFVTQIGAATIYYDGGSEIKDAKLRPVSQKENGINKTIKIKSSIASALTFNLYLDINEIDDNLKHESFRYALYKADSNTPVKEGNFSTTYLEGNTSDCTVNTGKKHIELLINEPVTTTLTTYTVYIWIDGANYNNPIEMTNKSFKFDLHATGENAILVEGEMPDITETIEGTLAYNLINLYNVAEKTEVFNNGVKYHVDYTNRLMSDIAGNLRYFGQNPHNYIYFNCSDYSNQSDETCEKWRIIGVFEGKLKLVRQTAIGTFSWDNNGSSGSNNWSSARLMKLLNPGYESETTGGSLYWNGGSGNCYSGQNNATKACDFTSTGLRNDTTREMISESIWYLGASQVGNIYPDETYTKERTSSAKRSNNPFTISAKVGLMYPSDYGYGVDFTYCNQPLSNYLDSTCTDNNWAYGKSNQWLITPALANSYISWGITKEGKTLNAITVYTAAEVRPVVYLNPEISVESDSNGSKNNPYKISVE